MKIFGKEKEFEELRSILSSMNIPNMRFVDMDVQWFLRNLGIRNSNHPNFDRAIELLKMFVD